MSITITDPAISALFASVTDAVEVRDANGVILGAFTRQVSGKPPPGMKWPFTDQQVAEFREQSRYDTGRSLDVILSDLEKKHGK